MNGFLVNWRDVKFCEIFFDGPLHASCLGCEVETDMRGQSNHCLRLCNVKMKKKWRGQKRPIPFWICFLVGRCTPPSLGWEVSAHMSGQSSDGLRVRNVEMKKFWPGRKRGTCTCMYGLRGPSVNRFEFFHHWITGNIGSSCCEHFLVKIN